MNRKDIASVEDHLKNLSAEDLALEAQAILELGR